VGGRTLGGDDSRRQGVHWVGMRSGAGGGDGDSDAASWVAPPAAYPLPAAGAARVVGGSGGGGGGGGGVAGVQPAGGGAAPGGGAGGVRQQSWALEVHHTWPGYDAGAAHGVGGAPPTTSVTCTAYMTDDLRKGLEAADGLGGTGGDAGEGDGGVERHRIGTFTLAVVEVAAGGAAGVAAPAARARGAASPVEAALARGPNRRALRLGREYALYAAEGGADAAECADALAIARVGAGPHAALRCAAVLASPAAAPPHATPVELLTLTVTLGVSGRGVAGGA
jgi:hypothetical protein